MSDYYVILFITSFYAIVIFTLLRIRYINSKKFNKIKHYRKNKEKPKLTSHPNIYEFVKSIAIQD